MSQKVSSPGGLTGYKANLFALGSSQKPSRGTAAYGRYVNRPAGRRVAAAAHLVGMTPNGATAISALFSGSGILLLALGEPSFLLGVAVAVLLAAGYVMDSVDGQLARLRGGGSVQGEWLDHTIDCFKTATLHLAVLVCWYRHPPVDNDAALLVPLLYEVVQVVTYFGFIVMPYLRAKRPDSAFTPAAPSEHPLRTWLILPTDYGFLCWAFLLLGWPVLFFSVYTALAALSAALLALGLRKWWRELGLIDEARGA